MIAIMFSCFLFVDFSCKKATEDIVDCIIESMFISVNADLDDTKPNLMHFKITYNGGDDVKLDNTINWDFGDGNKINADTIVDHTYANAGNYEAVISYTLRNGDGSSCSSSSKKQIVIP